ARARVRVPHGAGPRARAHGTHRRQCRGPYLRGARGRSVLGRRAEARAAAVRWSGAQIPLRPPNRGAQRLRRLRLSAVRQEPLQAPALQPTAAQTPHPWRKRLTKRRRNTFETILLADETGFPPADVNAASRREDQRT